MGWLVQVALIPAAICVVVAGGTVYAFHVVAGQLRELVAVRRTGDGWSPVSAPPTSDPERAHGQRPAEPAYLSYLAAQMWRDVWNVLRRSAVQLGNATVRSHRWLYETIDDEEMAIAVWPAWLGVGLGTVLLAVPLGLAAAGIAALLLTTSVVWAALWIVVVGVLGTVERGLLVVRRIIVACPHPGCHRRFGLPAYACPSDTCTERHWRLVPNRHGALRHVCTCGARLPTLIVLGRYRLPAYCPDLKCRRPLPKRAGRVRAEHVPIVGGNNAGKSTFLALCVGALRTQVEETGGDVGFEDMRDERTITRALALLREGERLDKTIVELPRALMLDVRPAGTDGRILYFFDPAGEYYHSKEMVESQRYLDHAEVVLLVVDPLALDLVHRSLDPDERRRVEVATPANPAHVMQEGPGAVVDRLLSYLQTRDGRARLRRVLVVVSKTDIMRSTTIGRPLSLPDPDVREWLIGVGWGNSVRLLDRYADEVRYLASGLDLTDAAFTEPVSWLIGVGPHTGTTRRRTASWRPWTSPSRPGRIPVGYRGGRMALLVFGSGAAFVSLGYGLFAVVGVLLGIYRQLWSQ